MLERGAALRGDQSQNKNGGQEGVHATPSMQGAATQPQAQNSASAEIEKDLSDLPQAKS